MPVPVCGPGVFFLFFFVCGFFFGGGEVIKFIPWGGEDPSFRAGAGRPDMPTDGREALTERFGGGGGGGGGAPCQSSWPLKPWLRPSAMKNWGPGGVSTFHVARGGLADGARGRLMGGGGGGVEGRRNWKPCVVSERKATRWGEFQVWAGNCF